MGKYAKMLERECSKVKLIFSEMTISKMKCTVIYRTRYSPAKKVRNAPEEESKRVWKASKKTLCCTQEAKDTEL